MVRCRVIAYIILSCLQIWGGGAKLLTIPVELVNVDHTKHTELFEFEHNDATINQNTQQFCNFYNVDKSFCALLLEKAVETQLRYYQDRLLNSDLQQCEEADGCTIHSFIASPHLKRSTHALSAEIITHNQRDSYKLRSFLKEEQRVVDTIQLDLTTAINAKTANNTSQRYPLVYSPLQLCFIHSCSIEGEKNQILDDMLGQIVSSGAIASFDRVYVLNYGLDISDEVLHSFSGRLSSHSSSASNAEESSWRDDEPADKIRFLEVSRDTSHFEIPTLRIMHAISRHYQYLNSELGGSRAVSSPHDAHFLYLHTKGVSYSETYPQISDWRNYMLYFLVEKHRACAHLLSSGQFDAVGVNYKPMPRDFRGNFWWATGRYLAGLPVLSMEKSGKYEAEQWLLNSIGEGSSVRVFSMHESQVDHHFTPYPRWEYCDNDEDDHEPTGRVDSIVDGDNSNGDGGGANSVKNKAVLNERDYSEVCFAKKVFWKR